MTETLTELETQPNADVVAEQIQQPDANIPSPELMQEPEEYVEGFIDKNGVDRSPEYPLVLLNGEAREAVEGYFDDHNQLAVNVDKQLDDLDTIRTVQQEHLNGRTVLGLAEGKRSFTGHTFSDEAIHADKALKNDVLRAVGIDNSRESVAVAKQPELEPASLSEQDKKLLDLDEQKEAREHEIKEIEQHVETHQPNSEGEMSAKTAKSLIDNLPESVKQRVIGSGISTELGLKAKFNSTHRQEVTNGVRNLLHNFIEEARDDIEHIDGKLTVEMTIQILDIVRENLEDVDVQAATASEDNCYIIDQELGDVKRVNGVVEQHGQQLAEVAKNVGALTNAQDIIRESIATSSLADRARKLPEDKQLELAQSVLSGLRSKDVISSEQRQQIDTLMGSTVTITADTAARTLSAATRSIYAEKALPVSYISDEEVAKLQSIYDKLNGVIKPRIVNGEEKKLAVSSLAGNATDHIKNIRKSTTQYRGDRVLYHATNSMKQIIESGALMTLEEQVMRHGVFRISTGAIGPNEDMSNLNRHSTVMHFATGIESKYIGNGASDGDEVAVPGVVAVPISEIIKHAPIDRAGYTLTELPLVEAHQNSGDGIAYSGSSSDMYNDYVFYATEEEDSSDNYILPLIGGEAFIVSASNGGEVYDIDVPEELSDRVHTGFRDTALDIRRGSVRDTSEMKRIAERRATATHGGTFVVPLRRSALSQHLLETPGEGLAGRKLDLSNARVVRNG